MPGRRPWRRRRPDRPPLRKLSGWLRDHSGPAKRGRAAPSRRRAGWARALAAGRRARARAQGASRRASWSPTAKRRSRSAPSSALRRRILAEAAALLEAPRRERSAPGGGRVAAQAGVQKARGRRRRKTADRPALPFRSPAPRPGPATAVESLVFWDFRRGRGFARRGCRTARQRPRRGRRRVGTSSSRSARITSPW